MATSQLTNTNLQFNDSSANNGTLSFASNEFAVNKPLQCSSGVNTTQLSVSGSGQVVALANLSTLHVDTLDTDSHELNGSTSGTLTMQAAATTTDHTLTMPAAQGASNSYLKNDGSGGLAWGSPIVNSHSGNSSNFEGYVTLGTTRICYGQYMTGSDSAVTVTLPLSYTYDQYSVALTVNTDTTNFTGSNNIGVPLKLTGKTTSSFTVDRDDDMGGNMLVCWQAIGYCG